MLRHYVYWFSNYHYAYRIRIDRIGQQVYKYCTASYLLRDL